MNPWLCIALLVIFCSVSLNITAIILNMRSLRSELPERFSGVLSIERYITNQKYCFENYILFLSTTIVTSALSVTFLILGGFNVLDQLVRSFGYGEIITGLIYINILAILAFLIFLPSSVYSTFVIEAKYGFNRTTVAIYLLDIIKYTLLMLIVGNPVLSMIFWLFLYAESMAWVYCLAGITLFVLLLHLLAPALIIPLFLNLSPLTDIPLRKKIEAYATAVKFPHTAIFTADSSKRSTKSNAFFTGFGRNRKIVLFDTLLERLSTDEIVSVLAHEIGHYTYNHIWKMNILAILQFACILFIFSRILGSTTFFNGLGIDQSSIHVALGLLAFLYLFFDTFISIPLNAISRKFEKQADFFAATTYDPRYFSNALKSISLNNFSNLTPHPFAVFLHYSHPPVLERLNMLAEVQSPSNLSTDHVSLQNP